MDNLVDGCLSALLNELELQKQSVDKSSIPELRQITMSWPYSSQEAQSVAFGRLLPTITTHTSGYYDVQAFKYFV